MSATRDSLRSAILAANDHRMRPVPVPEWGLESGLFVRSMSIADATAFNRAIRPLADDESVLALYLAYTLADESGEKVFDPSQASDLEELGKRDAIILARLYGEAVAQNRADADPGADLEEKSGPNRS